MRGRSVVLSNGYGQFHLARLAENLYSHGELAAFLTGGYVSRSSMPRVLDRIGPLRRLGERGIGVPDRLISSFWAGEIPHQAGQRLAHAGNERLAEVFVRRSLDSYARSAARHLRRGAGGGIYHFRAGMGGVSLDAAAARGMVTLCDQSIAHPRLLPGLVAGTGGRAGTLSYLWARVEHDMDAADGVIVNSRFVADTCVAAGMDPAKLHVAYTGVDPGFLREVDAARDDTRFEDVRVMFAGTLERRKGIDTVIEAARALGPGRVLWSLVGDWEPDAQGLRERVPEFVGTSPKLSRRELARSLAGCSVFVFPSRAEGSARVVAEALTAGCHVITTPGTGSVVRDGVDGAVVPSGDAEAIVGAVERYLALSPEERARRSAETARYARDALNEAAYTGAVRAAYDSVS